NRRITAIGVEGFACHQAGFGPQVSTGQCRQSHLDIEVAVARLIIELKLVVEPGADIGAGSGHVIAVARRRDGARQSRSAYDGGREWVLPFTSLDAKADEECKGVNREREPGGGRGV